MATECERISISANEGKILADLVSVLKPKSLVEIGTGYGVSTGWIAKAMPPQARLVTFDPNPKVGSLNLPNVWFVRGRLADFMSAITIPLDFAFLDGDHQIEKIVEDIELLEPYLRTNAVVVVHDIDYAPEMGICLKHYFEGRDSSHLQAIPVKPSTKRWTYREIHTDCGLGVATYA